MKRLALTVTMFMSLTGCTKWFDDEKGQAPEGKGPAVETANKGGNEENKPQVSEVQTSDTKEGEGAAAENGKLVKIHYTGYLPDGQKFDSSKDREEPFTFALGNGQVIKGMEVGVQGMKVGGSRSITIPAELAYGEAGISGIIPPKSDLKFEVELLSVEELPKSE